MVEILQPEQAQLIWASSEADFGQGQSPHKHLLTACVVRHQRLNARQLFLVPLFLVEAAFKGGNSILKFSVWESTKRVTY